jgi:hypothetical protein
MFIKMSIVLLTLFNISLLHCMEPELKISTKKIIKRKSQAILRKLSNETIDEQSATDNHTTLVHPFIIAAHNAIESKNYTQVRFYLRNPHLDPNITDQQGYSALQIFIKAQACQGIELLLSDHRAHFKYEDLYKEDNNQIRVFECLDKSTEASQSIRQKIFARFTLDLVTYEKCKSIESFYTYNHLTHEILTETINRIKTAIEQAAAKQIENHATNDENPILPELTGSLPDYATNEFIEKKIWFVLSSMHNTNNI